MSPLDELPGVWQGDGEGHYPTITTFGYREELVFARLGDKPVLRYAQRTWHHDDGRPLHVECGYLRVGDGRVELVLAQPTGFTEVHHGRSDGSALDLGLTAFARTASAEPVETLRRRWQLDGTTLVCELWMAYGDVVDGHHLRSTLRRVAGSDAG